MTDVNDPLRSFGAVSLEDDISEEISLDDDPVDQLKASLEHAAASDQLASSFTAAATTGHFGPLSDSLENVDLEHSGAAIARPGSLESEINAAGNDGADASAAAAAAAGPSSASASTRPAAHVRVVVSDPVKRVTDSRLLPGFTNSHYEYLVTSAPINGASIDAWPRAEVRRRFNDFVALADLLAETQRGFFIFPRPDKGVLESTATGKSDNEFVEQRRAELERYLRRLAQHPVVGHSEELRVFLTAEGSLKSSFHWQQLLPFRGSFVEGMARLPGQLIGSQSAVPTTTDAAKNPKNTNDMLRWLKEMGERMRQEYQPPTNLPESEVALRQAKAGVESYGETLARASRHAEKMLREFEKCGAATGDLGLALIRLGKYEDEEGSKCGQYTEIGSAARVLAADSRRVGMAAVRTSRLARSAAAESVMALEPLHTELAMAPAVTDALQEREAALLTVQSIQDDIAKKQGALATAEVDASKARRADSLRNEIASLDAALDAAEAEYERVKGRNESELERWRAEKAAELGRMTSSFSRATGTFYTRAAEVWDGVGQDPAAGGTHNS